MDTVAFSTFKAASKFPLGQIASFFNISRDAGWKEYIKISGDEIEKIFMYDTPEKSVYLYSYGCITFVNFSQEEIRIFFDYLNKLYVETDPSLTSQFNEAHAVKVNDDGTVSLWRDSDEIFEYSDIICDIVSSVLAKSTELYKIETELTKVLDEADKFIVYMSLGYLRANSRKVISTIAQCIRFKYRSIESVRILDRPPEFNRTIESREIFDSLSRFYELDDRYEVMTNRMGILDSVTGEYFEFRSQKSEQRLIFFELILLLFFPLFRILFE